MTKENPTQAVLDKLKTYLSYRAYSEHELRLKLKSFDEQAVEKALEQARESKWLSPPEELASRLAEELHRKKKGWLLIQSALRKKKLPLIPKQEELEEEKCLWWLAKKHSGKKPSPVALKKMYQFLSYRGFEGATIKKVLQEYFNKK